MLKIYSQFNEKILLKYILRGDNLAQYIFKRYEKKYLLNTEQYNDALNMLSLNTVSDTPDFRIIRKSIEKPVYKEKLRLRCYGKPSDKSTCFLEIKKKFKGVVYKRRIATDYIDGYNYLTNIYDK